MYSLRTSLRYCDKTSEISVVFLRRLTSSFNVRWSVRLAVWQIHFHGDTCRNGIVRKASIVQMLLLLLLLLDRF